jgi:hypothetical protein
MFTALMELKICFVTKYYLFYNVILCTVVYIVVECIKMPELQQRKCEICSIIKLDAYL